MGNVHEYVFGFSPRNSGKACKKCTVKFENGDIVISKHRASHKRSIYHKKCWEKMFQ